MSDSFVACFEFVRDTYRTAARLLRASEPVMSERGLSPYKGWAVTWPDPGGLEHPELWLKTWAIRQFFSEGKEDRDVVTVGVVFFDFGRSDFRPLLIVSRMGVTSTDSDEIYRLGLVQRGTEHPPDGVARWIPVDSPGVPPFLQAAGAVVEGRRVLSAALPLLSVNAIEDVERLVGAVLTASEGPA